MIAQPRHLYLFTLEIVPLEVGKVYGELPLHCTLMHRFWSVLSSAEMSGAVRALFDATPPLPLVAYKHALLGPKQMAVSLLKPTKEMEALNMALYQLLNNLGVEYTAPQWVGKGHVFHVTEREDARLEVGGKHMGMAAYLIEVENKQRLVRAKFGFNG